MHKQTAADLVAFLVVAQEQSFTKAAKQRGVSQSALSQTMRALETRLGVRLLTRTTRRVSPTHAGERLLQTVGQRFAEVDAELEAVTALGENPRGTLRLAATENAAATVLWPKLEKFLPLYPEIKIEIVVDVGLTDIVGGRFDAGIRPGETVAQGMIATRIGPDMRMAVVGTPVYFEQYGQPRAPSDLTFHNCINLRLPTHGGLYAWEFEKDGRTVNVHVDGQLVVGSASLILMGARSGQGLAYLPEEQVKPDIEHGSLIRVLEDWCPPFSGYHLYYPSRRQPTQAFSLLVDALRYRD
ncbi:LysR family transcriptional regulator [Pseudomonas sp. W4I3]|uniref:LysR family transcriptional regulator n=1 Tax=Pseudomonas sp. W4I3 TaxID=3042294 RepID=UPI00278AFB53|nr:LysR family transcriptional regulator [Pseudomonas sp. W4I3]MDQ0740941.1 DNA-binding transcriptional LysR family regulator [Pseudomonas sp. W4I3]